MRVSESTRHEPGMIVRCAVKKTLGFFLVEPRCSLWGGFTQDCIKFPSGVLLDREEIASSQKDAPRNDRIKELPVNDGLEHDAARSKVT